MPMTCPHCLQDDLRDGAKRCHHCGQLTDPAAEAATTQDLRAIFREEIREDLVEHRTIVDTMLKRLQTVAMFIVGAAVAAVAFLLFDTKENVRVARQQILDSSTNEIENSAKQIRETAEAEIRQTTESVKEQAQAEIVTRVSAMLDSEEVAQTIDNAIQNSVTKEVDAAVTAEREAIDARIADAKKGLEETLTQVALLKEEVRTAVAEVSDIRTAFSTAQEQQLADTQSVLPIEPVREEGKADPGRIPEYLAQGVESLSFRLGGYYDGPITWKYMDRLSTNPDFQYVVLFEEDGDTLFGLLDAAALKARLDPPDQAKLSAEMGNDPWATPNWDSVPEWSKFAERVSERDTDWLRALPSFQSAEIAVGAVWSSVKALSHMDQQRADILPVVSDSGAFAGVVSRSRLTSALLIELAGRQR